MGEQVLTLESAPDETVAAARARRRPRAAAVAAMIAAIALLISGSVAWAVLAAQQAAHDEARTAAEEARAAAEASLVDETAALELLEQRLIDAATLRDAVDAQVLPHAALLGGDEALAPMREMRVELGEAVDANGVLAEGRDAELRDAPSTRDLPVIDPEATTEELHGAAARFDAIAAQVRASRLLLAERAGGLAAGIAGVEGGLRALADSLPATNDALLAARTLAFDDVRAAAAAAIQALDGVDARELPAALAAYATAASAVIAAHDAEAARLAAEEAARQAAAAAAKPTGSRSGSRGGGSGSTSSAGGGGGSGSGATGGVASRGVLNSANDHRAANGIGPLAWNSTLANAACSWAAQQASENRMYHGPHTWPSGARTVGENVAYGYASAALVMNGWMNSPGHRANILNGAFTMMGACYADAADGTRYWAQKFAG